MLTPRQKQILDFTKTYTEKKGFSPSFEEIKRHFRLSSVSTVYQHIEALKNKGYLEGGKNQKRAIAAIKNQKMIQIPILGTITAGKLTTLFDAVKETIAVPKNNLPPSSNIYALRVSGDSMIDDNINNGDIILVRHQETAENGQKVVVIIDNQEATLKKFYKKKEFIHLQPANKSYEPIIIRKDRDIKIQGIIIDVIQNKSELQTQDFLPTIQLKRDKNIPLNKIILGDAIIELKKLPDESCDVVIIDPPYNIGKDFGNNIDKRDLKEYVSWCKEWINESIRVMKPTGTMFIYGFSEILAHLSVEIPINKRWLIWHYTNKNVASFNFWQRSHESIICAWKNKPIFNKDLIREPYTKGFLNGAAGKVRKGTAGRFGKNGQETIYNAHKGGALPRDVIKIPALAGGAGMIERWFLCKTCNDVFEPRQLKKHEKHNIIKHPTQKPLELSQKLILSAIPKNDGVVLVPFVGTGSECVAAKKLKKSYIGFEINPDYIRIAEKYLNNL